MLFVLILVAQFTTLHATTKEIEEARKSVRSLIAPLLPGPKKPSSIVTKDFRVDQCQREKINWTDVLLMRKSVTLDFKFKEGCDVEGTVAPKIFSAFPADFKLRNLKLYDHVVSSNTVGATFESNPLMTIEMREGVLTGKNEKVKFEADYKVILDLMNKKNPVKKNLGGELRITEIGGKKVSIKEKIFVE